MHLRVIAIVCLAIVHHSSCNGEMEATENPILDFLQLDTDSPPKHELVNIELLQRLHKRDISGKTMPAGTRMRFRAFGKDVNLWLHPIDSPLVTSNTPVYYSRYAPDTPGNVSIEEQPGMMKAVGQILENAKHLASLVVGKDINGRMTINGRIGSKNLVVRSLPKSLVSNYVRKHRSIDNLDDDFSNSINHVVYSTESEREFPLGAFNDTMPRARLARLTGNVPNVLYPKILVLMEYSTYSKQGCEIYGFLEYILAFWNGVDLVYRNLAAPKVKLHISAIIIGVEPEGTPYIFDQKINNDTFDADMAMYLSREFFYNIRDSIPLASYDIAHTSTRLGFGTGRYASSVIGKAYTDTVCTNTAADKTKDAVSISQDNGAFSGVHVAAHELGHVFGLEHEPRNNEDCVYSNGFIMASTPWYTTNSSSFSSCSLEVLQKIFDRRGFKCMYEKPRTNGVQKFPRLMPGRLKHLDEQCSALGYGLPCKQTTDHWPNLDICVNYFCLDSIGECRETGTAALAGTICSDENEVVDRFCVNNRCVRVFENRRMFPRRNVSSSG